MEDQLHTNITFAIRERERREADTLVHPAPFKDFSEALEYMERDAFQSLVAGQKSIFDLFHPDTKFPLSPCAAHKIVSISETIRSLQWWKDLCSWNSDVVVRCEMSINREIHAELVRNHTVELSALRSRIAAIWNTKHPKLPAEWCVNKASGKLLLVISYTP